jgi:hypothetical protein
MYVGWKSVPNSLARGGNDSVMVSELREQRDYVWILVSGSVAPNSELTTHRFLFQSRNVSGLLLIERPPASFHGVSIFSMLSRNAMKRARIGIIFYLTAVAVAATPPDKARFAPDIFLVTIHSRRTDHVHCYGYDGVQTPALDGLAEFISSPQQQPSWRTLIPPT